MNMFIQAFISLLVVTGLLSTFVFFGCGADTLGPYKPLLPAVTGNAKFSDRFILHEESQFFYDLYGKEVVEGSELSKYVDQKQLIRMEN